MSRVPRKIEVQNKRSTKWSKYMSNNAVFVSPHAMLHHCRVVCGALFLHCRHATASPPPHTVVHLRQASLSLH